MEERSLPKPLMDMIASSKRFDQRDGLFTSTESELEAPMLALAGELRNRALDMFKDVLLLTKSASSISQTDAAEQAPILQRLFKAGLRGDELADELYLQLIKQTGIGGGNASPLATTLIELVAAVVAPSKQMHEFVAACIGKMSGEESDEKARKSAMRAQDNVSTSMKLGARMEVPTVAETETALAGDTSTIIVFFLDGNFEETGYSLSTTVDSATKDIARKIGLQNNSAFTLFERSGNASTSECADGDGINSASDAEDVALNANQRLADMVARMRDNTSSDSEPKLVFKKRLLRDSDIDSSDEALLKLVYLQVKEDYLRGRYPANAETMALVSSFILREEKGAGGDLTGKEGELDAVVPKTASSNLLRASVISNFNANKWLSGVEARRKALASFKELPYMNSAFFCAKRDEDPIGLLPGKILMGINGSGVYFFRPTPPEFLFSARLRDISQFGSSASAAFFKMRASGTLHVFQFGTSQGEEICHVLQTHINDVLERRRSAKQAQKAHVAELAALDDSGNVFKMTPSKGAAEHCDEQLRAAGERIRELNSLSSDLSKSKTELEGRISQLETELGTLTSRLEGERAERADLAKANDKLSEELRQASIRDEDNGSVASPGARQNAQDADEETVGDEAKGAPERNSQVAAQVEAAEKRAKQAEKRATELEEEKRRNKEGMEMKQEEVNRMEKEKEEMRRMMESDSVEELEKEIATLKEDKTEAERSSKQAAETIKQQSESLKELEAKYKEEMQLRKRHWNTIEDLKGKIRVFARSRPLTEKEKKEDKKEAVAYPDECTIEHRGKKDNRSYVFDRCFKGEAKQEEVFEEMRNLVRSSVDGYNVCVFAYGQTGSGKTHTIHGSESEPGITPKAISELFRLKDEMASKTAMELSVTMLELYQDSLSDLFVKPPTGSKEDTRPKLEIKKDSKTGWVTVLNATKKQVETEQEVRDALQLGVKHRKVAQTEMNVESSRSHLIFTVEIKATDMQTQQMTNGKLSLVDLAGSERNKKSGSTGEKFKEAQAINKSLSALGDVVSALATEQSHIPFRNHKLTMLMSDSLGGNAKTLMFVNVAPAEADLDETQNSLSYAARVKTIQNDPRQNVDSREQQRLNKLVSYWKKQAGRSPSSGASDHVDVQDSRPASSSSAT